MNKISIIIVTITLSITSLILVSFECGKTHAYEDIISEKCWLNKQTRDIECIQYIGK